MSESILKQFEKTLAAESILVHKGFHQNDTKHKTSNYFFKSKKSAETVVFAHATGNDNLFPQMPLFLNILKNGFNVLTFDLDGHGAQSTTILEKTNFWGSIDRAVEFLKREYDIKSFHLMGQSLGGHWH